MSCIKTGAKLLIECYDAIVPADIYEVADVRIAVCNMAAPRPPVGPDENGVEVTTPHDWVLTGQDDSQVSPSQEWWRPHDGLFAVPARRMYPINDPPQPRPDLLVDPARAKLKDLTGIYIFAKRDGQREPVDIAELDTPSLLQFLRPPELSREWVESVVFAILRHSHDHVEVARRQWR